MTKLNHLASLSEWLSVRLQTKWSWVQISLLSLRYQNSLESMEGSKFVFDYYNLLYCKCQQIYQNRGGSYRDSPDSTINKRGNKYFQYTVTVALNYEEVKKDQQKIRKIKPSINTCN